MYFIENKEELIGKTIAYVDMNQFAEKILIATTDGGILIVSQESDEFNTEIEIHSKINTKYYILNCKKHNKHIYEDLIKHKVFTEEEYDKFISEHKKQQQEQEEKRLEKQKKAELEQYLKLKEKYENI